eukprot:8165667-Alexandrium_andersonii.AAC.1
MDPRPQHPTMNRGPWTTDSRPRTTGPRPQTRPAVARHEPRDLARSRLVAGRSRKSTGVRECTRI